VLRNLAVIACVVCGLVLIFIGSQSWLENRAVERAVDTFLIALQQGDRDTVLSLLNPHLRSVVERQSDDEALATFGEPLSGISYRIQQVKINGLDAVAHMWIEREGFIMQPTIHLTRDVSTRWKILKLDDLTIDPLWDDLQRERARRSDEELAQNLKAALQTRPGITVERHADEKSP